MLDDNFLFVAKQLCAVDEALRQVGCVVHFLKFHEQASI
jgi:hypothetical protein